MKKVVILLALFSINAFATPVNINTADPQTISQSLKGIGQKKAEVPHSSELANAQIQNAGRFS